MLSDAELDAIDDASAHRHSVHNGAGLTLGRGTLESLLAMAREAVRLRAVMGAARKWESVMAIGTNTPSETTDLIEELTARLAEHQVTAQTRLDKAYDEITKLKGDLAARPVAVPPLTDEPKAGLYGKFRVYRTDGSSDLHCKHHGCEYFVLDWTHDPFTLPAADAYAQACEATHPELAADIRKRLAAHGYAPQARPVAVPVEVQAVVDAAKVWAESFGPSHHNNPRVQGLLTAVRALSSAPYRCVQGWADIDMLEAGGRRIDVYDVEAIDRVPVTICYPAPKGESK